MNIDITSKNTSNAMNELVESSVLTLSEIHAHEILS